MPTYEYRREDGTTFEVQQGINEEPLSVCPDTGQKVKRIISGGGGVVYKGEGWYVTDYKKNDRKEKTKAEKSSSKANKKTSKSASPDSEKTKSEQPKAD